MVPTTEAPVSSSTPDPLAPGSLDTERPEADDEDYDPPVDWSALHELYLQARAAKLFDTMSPDVVGRIDEMPVEELVAVNLAGDQAAHALAGTPDRVFSAHELRAAVEAVIAAPGGAS